jgi:sugar phosphate isomerase/epimerase
VYWRDKVRELPAMREGLGRLGLKATFATFTTLYHRDPEKRAQLLQDLDDAHALGAPLLRVFRGDPPGDGPEDTPVRDGAKAVVERAGEYGMRLALENHIGQFGWRLADVQETLDRLASPVLGTNVDIANYAVNGQDPLAAIRALAPWIIYAHLKDVMATADGMKQTHLGNGTLPLAALVGAIEETGRDIPLCFEFGGGGDPEGAIAKSMAVMASL